MRFVGKKKTIHDPNFNGKDMLQKIALAHLVLLFLIIAKFPLVVMVCVKKYPSPPA